MKGNQNFLIVLYNLQNFVIEVYIFFFCWLYSILQYCPFTWTPRNWKDISMQGASSKTFYTFQLQVCFMEQSDLWLVPLQYLLQYLNVTYLPWSPHIRYSQCQLIEVNAHSLFSKWFSESGKLVCASMLEGLPIWCLRNNFFTLSYWLVPIILSCDLINMKLTLALWIIVYLSSSMLMLSTEVAPT